LEWIQKVQAIKISQEYKLNTKKKVIHHTTGSRGCTGKDETWQEQEEKATQLGDTPAIAKWTK
jgi:hypothetical protein